MTTISLIRRIIASTRSKSNNSEKRDYLESVSPLIRNFLAGNIKKDGIAKAIASEIPIIDLDKSMSDMESIISIFDDASKISSKTTKIRMMKQIRLTPTDREVVLTCLYGSLKLGLKIPIPAPLFGETIKPQLCGSGIEFDPSKMIIEEKFDGIRCLATNNNGKITLQSRNGKVLKIPTIERSLIGVIPDGSTLDGEIIDKSGDFQKLDRKSNNLIYMVFDIVFFNFEPITYNLIGRRELITRDIIGNKHVKISKILNFRHSCFNNTQLDEIDSWITTTGAEGIVAKDPNSLYRYGNRKDWIKYKHFQDCSCRVIDYTEGTGKRAGILGAINVIPDNSDVITKVGSGFTDDQLITMKYHIDRGDDITVDCKYQNMTNDGCMRFPTFLRIRIINGDEI